MDEVKWKWCTMFSLVGGVRKVYQRRNLFVTMKNMPAGYPPLFRPENIKNPMPEAMKRALDHLKSRLTGADIEWWTTFIAKEREKKETWEEMTEEHLEGGESFDISAVFLKSSPSDQDDDEDEEIFRAEAAILCQLNKEHCPERHIREMQVHYVVQTLTASAGR